MRCVLISICRSESEATTIQNNIYAVAVFLWQQRQRQQKQQLVVITIIIMCRTWLGELRMRYKLHACSCSCQFTNSFINKKTRRKKEEKSRIDEAYCDFHNEYNKSVKLKCLFGQFSSLLPVISLSFCPATSLVIAFASLLRFTFSSDVVIDSTTDRKTNGCARCAISEFNSWISNRQKEM